MIYWDEADGFIEGYICLYMYYMLNRLFYKQYNIFQVNLLRIEWEIS